MSVLNLLTDEDKNLINSYIHHYGPTIDNYITQHNYSNIETILNEWAVNKDEFLGKLFNNKLILTRPYTYAVQTEALTQDIDKKFFKDHECTAFYEWWTSIKYNSSKYNVEITYRDPNENIKRHSDWYWIDICFEPKILATNSYDGENINIKFPSGKTIKLFKGMRPMKILSYVAKEFGCDETIFDNFRIWHSQQLNQKYIDGKLCLSIHPLDYITMSDNDNGWTSCMRWAPSDSDPGHGDYRGGTVSCMNSPYIIIAYLHNPNHTFKAYHDFEWNSKQWRELFIIQEGVINEIKGYPFQDENLTNTCLMWIKELAEENLDWTYDNEEINVAQNITGNNYSLLLHYIPGTFMYKDIGTLPIHRGRINSTKLLGKYEKEQYYLNNKEEKTLTTFLNIQYGGIATCMCCGKALTGNEPTEVVMCNSCDNIRICPHCGEPIYNEEYIYIEDYNEPICEYCWEINCTIDDLNNESHLTDDMDNIYFYLGNNSCGFPVYSKETIWTYNPRDNCEYQYLFTEEPYNKDYKLCVDYSMIQKGKENIVKSLFFSYEYPYDNWNTIFEEELGYNPLDN